MCRFSIQPVELRRMEAQSDSSDCQRRAELNNDCEMTVQTPQSAPPAADTRPAFAIVSNSQTPYRLHLHRRIAREISEARLFSVFTHETSNSPWAFADSEEIGVVQFGKGENCDTKPNLRTFITEWRRG